jgi:DNA-directed RNA polymerase subunit RPC12/RpoP
MNTKLIVLIVLLVIGIGISVYLWTSGKGEAGDKTVMAQMQDFTCKKCGATFQKSVQDVTNERHAHDGHIYCPQCGAEDPEKEGVKVRMSGPAGSGSDAEAKPFDSDDQGKEAEEEQPNGPPKVAPPGMQKKRG